MKRAFKWFLYNGLFAAALYFGFVAGVENAQRVALFIVWVMAIMAPVYLHKDVLAKIKEKGRSVPAWIDVTFDLGVLFTLVWFGAVVSGVAYLFHFILHHAAFGKATQET